MDFQSGDDGGLDFYAGQGLHRNYARADFDRTLNFIQSYIYQLPFGKGQALSDQQRRRQDCRRLAGGGHFLGPHRHAR